MSDRLDREIRSMVVELVESSPAPHPAQAALHPRSRVPGPVTWRSGLARALTVAVVVVLVGLAGAWIGHNVFPPEPATQLPMVEGAPSPEPSFDPSEYGAEVRLLHPTGEVQPDVLPGILDGEVVAAGRIEGSDLEVFSWYTTDPPNGACLQVVGFRARHSTCAGTFGDNPRIAGPLVFPRLNEATGEVIDVVAAWQVPEGTAIVVAETSERSIWQRPKGGVVAFTFDSDTNSVTLHALDTNEETIRSQGISPSQTVEPTVNQEVPSLEGVPEWCPITVPDENAFTPSTEAPEGPPSVYEAVWYGIPDLWTMIDSGGEVWRDLPVGPDGDLAQKTLWWSEHLSSGESAEIILTAEDLGGSAPTVELRGPGGASSSPSSPSFGTFMVVGFELPQPGCWEITAEYKGASLSYVVWVDND